LTEKAGQEGGEEGEIPQADSLLTAEPRDRGSMSGTIRS